VGYSGRLLSFTLLSASLFAVERLRPIEVTRFHSFAEGIVFDSDGSGYVSHGRFISRIAPDGRRSIWAETGAPKGHKILADGTHLVCDEVRHAVLHLDPQGKILETASSHCDGKPLACPRDLVIDPRGGFYFTDSGKAGQPRAGSIHFVDRLGHTHLAAEDLHLPRGIAMRPDGKSLLVAEGMRNRILSYEVLGPGRLGPMKVFADLPPKERGQIDNQPDGLCLDQHGNLYVAHYGMGTVEVLSRKGRFIRQYPAGLLGPSGVAFGGSKMDQLFISGGLGAEGSSSGALFRMELQEKGLPLTPRWKP